MSAINDLLGNISITLQRSVRVQKNECSTIHQMSPTSHVVQSMLYTIYRQSTNNKVTVATYIDKKAFDCLQYKQLFTKMTALGFTKRTLNWFKSELSKRVKNREIKGKLSNHLDVELGVPEGSILGPVLFLV